MAEWLRSRLSRTFCIPKPTPTFLSTVKGAPGYVVASWPDFGLHPVHTPGTLRRQWSVVPLGVGVPKTLVGPKNQVNVKLGGSAPFRRLLSEDP